MRKETGRAPLDLNAVVDEVEGAWTGWDVWIHRETGEVYVRMESGFADEEDEEEIERLIDSGKLLSWEEEPWADNRRAERFIGGIEAPEVRERIEGTWRRRGRGRWHRFKASLTDAGLLREWYDYRRRCVRADVIDLLESEGVAYRESPPDA